MNNAEVLQSLCRLETPIKLAGLNEASPITVKPEVLVFCRKHLFATGELKVFVANEAITIQVEAIKALSYLFLGEV